MRFSKTESSKREGTVSVTPSQSLAIRFASVMLAAVLTASFMPVAAFADEGGTSDPEGVQNPPVQTEETQQGEQPAAPDQPAEPEAPAAPETPADPDQPAAPESSEATEPQAPAQQPEADASEAPSATKDESKDKSSKKDEDVELSTFKSESYTMKVGDKRNLDGRTAVTHSWSVGKPGIVEISGSGKTVTVTAIAPGTVVVKHDGLFLTDTFTITVTSSDIKDNVTLTTADVVEAYDGQPHAAGVASATDAQGNSVTIEYSADGTSWTADPSSITATNVSDSKTVRVRATVPGVYEGSVEADQQLTITQRPVTVTGDGFDSVQPYTHAEYSKDTYTYDNVLDGQEASISYQLKGTEPGSYTGEFGDDFAVTANGADVTANYELAGTVPGTLVISNSLNPGQSMTLSIGNSVTLQGNDSWWFHFWSVSKDGIIDLSDEGSSATVTAKASGEVTVTHKNLIGGNETFTIKVVKADISGKVTLEPTDVTVEYDGNAHTAGVATATDLSGNDVTIEYSADGTNWTADPSTISVTNAGSMDVSVRASVPDVYEGYVEGTEKLTVEPRAMTLKSSSLQKLYDGTPLTNGDASISGERFVGTDGATYSFTGSQTDADSSENSFTYTLNKGTVPGNYSINTECGTLTVDKRSVKLISASATREYNGKPLTNDEIAFEGDGWADGEGATYDVTGKQTLVGFSNNTFTYSLDEGTKADNYSIETSEGTLTVTSRDAKYEITVKANSDVFTYDGTEKSVSGFEALEFEVDGSIYTVGGLTAEAKGTDAGTYTAGIVGSPVVKDAEGNEVSSEFAVKGESGCLAIAKRQVSVTGEGFEGEQPYTGKEYSKTGCTFSNLVDGHEASITYELKGTEPGTYEGTFGDDFKVMAGGQEVTSNYELTEKVPGKLTIANGDPDTPVDPDKPSSDTPSKNTGKTTAAKAAAVKPASKSAKTGDSIALYVMGICGAAIAAGAVAFVARRKRNSDK